MATNYHINKPVIAAIGHSGHTTYKAYSSLGNMRSAVWEHFKKEKDDASCKHCGKTVKTKEAGQVVSSQRAQMKPEQANMLVFLAKNL